MIIQSTFHHILVSYSYDTVTDFKNVSNMI